MEASIPGNIRSETLAEALGLNETSLLVLSADDRVKWASEAAHALFDFSEARSLEGVRWQSLIQIDGESVWDPVLDETYHTQGYLKTDGFCDAGKRGRIAIQLVIYPNRGTDERLVVIRDITDRKAYEEELEDEKRNALSLNRALEHEIQKANELAVIAERANIAKSVFLTSMSHEFRTPLNGVLGYAQVLCSDESLNPGNQKAARTIEKCGQHLLSIINDVLDLSKIEAGKVEVAHEPMKIKSLVADVIDVFEVRATTKGLRLNCEWELNGLDLEWVVGDGKLIRQVLINLIGNAVKFTDTGSVTLRVTARMCDQTDPLCTKITLSVIDTGPGIDRMSLDQVFEEFYQTEAFSGHKGGTGLGLAISRKLAVAMGGRLFVESEVGEGSRFHLEFPSRRIEQMEVVEELPGETRDMRFVDTDVGYVQLFGEELDNGVLQRVLHGLGVVAEHQYRVFQHLSEISIHQHPKWLIGHSVGALSQGRYQELLDWVKSYEQHVILLVYLDRSEESYKSLLTDFKEKGIECVFVEIPIHVVRVKEHLRHARPVWFESNEKWVETNPDYGIAKAAASVSNECPDYETLKSMLKEAHMGDIRRLSQLLDEWVHTIGEPSGFEARVRQLLESFQIDQLCEFLDELIIAA